eukprot:TRINITY_DN4318_c0_g2_i1.p5 TRINITY_DN4318_c0_g2~~TRINITY_DN4318_c0_g2_i1.p5  ORF type:complete len:167 (-),score=17.68 TRINITY_DN4318_c0_g2_i1:1784-2284(-)
MQASMTCKLVLFFTFLFFGTTFSIVDGADIIQDSSVSQLYDYTPEMEISIVGIGLDSEDAQELEENYRNGDQYKSIEEIFPTSLSVSLVHKLPQDDPSPVLVDPDFIPVLAIIAGFVPTVSPLFPTLPYVLKPMEIVAYEGGYDIQNVFDQSLPVQASNDYFYQEY